MVGRAHHRRRDELPPRSSSSEESPRRRVSGATPLEAPFASPSAGGLHVLTQPERLLDGGLASGTQSSKLRRLNLMHGKDGGVGGEPQPMGDSICGYLGGTKASA
uniref:Uncharacterized protein n=1 Tax=Triticum urartu TaxID=4572 RepID=A0A8R7P429_TRIUA